MFCDPSTSFLFYSFIMLSFSAKLKNSLRTNGPAICYYAARCEQGLKKWAANWPYVRNEGKSKTGWPNLKKKSSK